MNKCSLTPLTLLKHSFSCTSNFYSVVFDIIYLHESIIRDMNTLCTMNDPTVVHTCPLKSPHCNLLTVFREMITVSVHAWKDTVWWSFLHDAQFNQKSQMQNICSVKLLRAVWQTYEGVHVGPTRAVLFADVFFFETSPCPFSSSLQKNYHMPKKRTWACIKSWTRPCRNWTAYKHAEETGEDEIVMQHSFNVHIPHFQL